MIKVETMCSMVTFEDDVVRMEEFKNRIKRTLIIEEILTIFVNFHNVSDKFFA